ncbi:MAG: methyl-accepting chemotaxis protein [Geothermobacteraceae bacterium]
MNASRTFTCSLTGFFLGLLAPAGWFLIRLAFFQPANISLGEFFTLELAGSTAQSALYSYMGLGTAIVFSCFGYVIGRVWTQLDARAEKLTEMHHTVQMQRNEFEERFNTLYGSLKNLHTVNARIQMAGSFDEIIRLAGEGLHGVLGYDRVNIWLVDRGHNALSLALSEGTGFDDTLELPLDERLGVIYKTFVEGRPRLVEDMRQLAGEDHLAEQYANLEPIRSRSFILCPIRAGGQVLGLIGVDNKTSRRLLGQTDVDTIRLFADQMAMSLSRVDLLGAVESLTGELNRTFAELPDFRRNYQALNGDLIQAGKKNRAALADISGGAGVIQEAVDETRSASSEISVAIQQVGENINSLHAFIDATVSAVTEITATLKEVEESAVKSEQLTETVQVRAGEGVERLKGTISALKEIHDAVSRATERIGQLSELAEEIGGVTVLIGEIAGKTNLLALNAAIIAAQAGEHGTSFAVVADEVRALAGDAARSTEEIARLVGQIRQATSEGVNEISATNDLVDKGIASGFELEIALGQVVDDAEKSTSMSRDIRRATNEVTHSAASINRSVVEVREMAEQVSHASKEQTSGMKSIVHAIEEIKAMTDDMVASVGSQEHNMAEIEHAIDRIGSMAQHIFQELEGRRQKSSEVVEKLGALRHTQDN